jgi:hypothetical protein
MGAAAYGTVLGVRFGKLPSTVAHGVSCAISWHKLDHVYLGAAELRSEMTRPYGEERASRSK